MHPDILRLHAEIEEKHWWFVARRAIVGGLVRRLVPPDRGHVVLDLGCGTGANLGALRHDYDCRPMRPKSTCSRIGPHLSASYPRPQGLKKFA
jgi:hypothetical protein